MKWRLRSFMRFLRRLRVWLPVIWRDEDWDYAYLYEMMRVKIRMMRLDNENYDVKYGCKRDLRSMRVAETLLERLANGDFYYDNMNAQKDDRCTCVKLTDEQKWQEMKSGKRQPFCGYCQWLIKNRFHQKEQEDMAYLCDILKKDSRSWWN